jgi:DNA mismatch repair protein MutL
MTEIKILPEIISNKIAAGEVVERPASVVKELVENALDAHSTRVIIEVEKGGRALIRVADNGAGMHPDDALLALERYATSKISTGQDLFNISTLGFRGEALPSIAAVSRFTLVTRVKSASAGTEIRVAGGKIQKVFEVGTAPGTMITVARLFYNTPARRKFLKSINTEMGHVAETISRMALARPDVHFKLQHNSKPVKDWPAVSEPIDRVADLLGSAEFAQLYPIAHESDGLHISGWISSPRFSRRTSRRIFVYVNGRFVRDKIVRHALLEGYAQRLVKGQYPVAVLFLTVPFDRVDVNVHPTKSEVRFAEPRHAHDALKRIVAETLNRVDRPQWSADYNAATKPVRPATRVSEQEGQGEGFRTRGSGYEVQSSRFKVQGLQKRAQGSKSIDPEAHEGLKAEGSEKNRKPGLLNFEPGTPYEQAAIWPQKQFRDFRIIGQFRNSYILCEAGDGLILIDQHAAHERILFEHLKNSYKEYGAASQKLLVPETVELGYREADILERLIPDFDKLGLEVEPFGGNTFVVKSVPSLLAGREVTPLIMEIVEKAVAIGVFAGVAEFLDACLEIMACHGAIRANQVLSDDQMRGLLNQLDHCDNPAHCPHGRPTWIQWTLAALEKSFKRRF